MAITRQKKEQLVQQYVENLQSASNAVVVQQQWVDVNTVNAIRKEVKESQWRYTVVRKNLLMRAVKEAGLSDIDREVLQWSVLVITADESDEYGPLKAVNKALKKFKPDSWSSFVYLGWWFEKEWKDWAHVAELANIPSTEELIGKLMFLLKYPMQSLVSVADQIAKKQWWPEVKEEVKEEPKEEVKEEVKEEPKEEVKEEVKEEPKEEVKEEPKEEDEADSSKK